MHLYAINPELLTWSKDNLSQSGVGIGIGIFIDGVFFIPIPDSDPDPEKKRTYFGAHQCPKKGANSLEFRGYSGGLKSDLMIPFVMHFLTASAYSFRSESLYCFFLIEHGRFARSSNSMSRNIRLAAGSCKQLR